MRKFDSEGYSERKTFFEQIHLLYPNNPWLNKATEKMKSFSKEDHLQMLEESYYLYDTMQKFAIEGVPIESKDSEKLFDVFISHVERFLVIDDSVYDEIVELCRADKNQVVAVNRIYAQYLYNMLNHYKYKIPGLLTR